MSGRGLPGCPARAPQSEAPSDRDQVTHEDEGLAGRDRVPGTAVPVGQVRRNDQLPAAADLHALHALVPAGDDLPDPQLELQRIPPVPARVEFLAGGIRDSDVMHLDHVARARHGAVALPDIRDLQPGRRLAAGEVDLRSLDAHTHLSLRSSIAAARAGPARHSRASSWRDSTWRRLCEHGYGLRLQRGNASESARRRSYLPPPGRAGAAPHRRMSWKTV